jgi:hypothetical protein
MKRIAALLLLLASPVQAADLYQTATLNFPAIQVLDYSLVNNPIGSCALAWQLMTAIVPDVQAGDIIDARAQVMLSARESGVQAAVGWVVHVEPWTGSVPLNVQLPCFEEPWVGEDIGPARPYLAARGARVWRAGRNYPNGVLVMLRLYAQSAAPFGALVIPPTSALLDIVVQHAP